MNPKPETSGDREAETRLEHPLLAPRVEKKISSAELAEWRIPSLRDNNQPTKEPGAARLVRK
jgi:hypothetical protein